MKNYYKLDSRYRHFIAAYDKLTDSSEFGGLFDMVENSYTNWFLHELSMKWCALWDDEEKWELPGITVQQSFYSIYASGAVHKNERVIVIISDGLRYESAVELNNILNHEQKGKSEIDTMFGAVPSFTSLGMSSLLPRKKLSITDRAEFEIDGISTEGTDNKNKILSLVKKESIALWYDDIMEYKKKGELSAKLSGMKLIYIYGSLI